LPASSIAFTSQRVDLQSSLTPGVFPATFEFRDVVRRKRSDKSKGSSAAIAEWLNRKHDKLSIGALVDEVGDPDHPMERKAAYFLPARLTSAQKPVG
jgi:hypothetical protein